MQDPRERIQQEAKASWLQSDRKNTVIVPTGGGKSKIAIDLIKELNPLTILLLTNSEDLRDTSWKKEFEKFEAMVYWERTQSECYQTMYRRTGEWDLIIFDKLCRIKTYLIAGNPLELKLLVIVIMFKIGQSAAKILC